MFARQSRREAKRPLLWRPSQYAGEPAIVVTATQLDDRVSSAAERKRILGEWIEFLSHTTTQLREIELASRTPQELLDALGGQTQLEVLSVKWGPYRELQALGRLAQLRTLRLRGATSVVVLDSLVDLVKLTTLTVSQAHRLATIEPLREMSGLEHLVFGNEHPGDDKPVSIPDLEWVRPLLNLRSLALPGTRMLTPDLSPILDLPNLKELRIPLRRAYRKQVLDFAQSHEVFADVAREYESFERWKAANRG